MGLKHLLRFIVAMALCLVALVLVFIWTLWTGEWRDLWQEMVETPSEIAQFVSR